MSHVAASLQSSWFKECKDKRIIDVQEIQVL